MSAIALLPRAPARDTALEEALARYDANMAAYRVLCAKMRAPNRAALFEALAAARISHVIVTLDPDDDDGRIEQLALIAHDRSTQLPLGPIALSIPQWGLPDPIPLELSIPHAIERMACDCLEQAYGICEVDLSGPDKVAFNVAARSIVPVPRHGGKANA
ncbi:DUF6878 family protein [Mesorhizobium sp. M0276]|uniref:DUF6878 family protein n=1 Tax=Mesorhizobium sp. M0276 TaxID=2956928 RepID=UPI00333566D8